MVHLLDTHDRLVIAINVTSRRLIIEKSIKVSMVQRYIFVLIGGTPSEARRHPTQRRTSAFCSPPQTQVSHPPHHPENTMLSDAFAARRLVAVEEKTQRGGALRL